MGIRFLCPNCDKKLNVKAFLAGKRGICPYCDSGLDIPLESEAPNGTATTTTTKSVEVRTVARREEAEAEPQAKSSALADTAVADDLVAAPSDASGGAKVDPIDEDPEAVWYVRPPSGGQFGPAKGDVMRKWVEEGRVSPEALVWREGWADWLTAAPVFPSLQTGEAAPPPPPSAKNSSSPAQSKPVASATAVASPAPRTVAADPQIGAADTKTNSASKTYAKRRSNLPALIAVVALVIVSILLLIGLALALSGTFS